MSKNINRIGITFAAATIALFAGIYGPRAQEQASMFADADGLEPPDAGIAYEIPASSKTMAQQDPFGPQLVALLSDPDGMNCPDEGFAYALPVPGEGFAEVQSSDTQGLVFDADGLEPPDIGVAYEIVPVIEVVAEGPTETNK
jgi:hypothetical protein